MSAPKLNHTNTISIMSRSEIRNVGWIGFSRRSIVSVALIGIVCQVQPNAIAVTWNSATANSLWSVSGNWTGGLPAGEAVVFGATGRTAPGIAGNIVDQSLTIDSLAYVNGIATGGTTGQTTQINSGVTLTISTVAGNILDVGTTSNGVDTLASIQGAGTLKLDQADGSILIGSRGVNSATLNLADLASFEANVDVIRVGGGRGGDTYRGSLSLAVTNSITANSLLIASRYLDSRSTGIHYGTVNLGTTNTLSIDRIDVGSDRGLGTLQFQTGLTNATVVIQGKDSSITEPTRAELNVGYPGAGSASSSYGGTADFTGGAVDAYLSTLRVGVLSGDSAAPVTGQFSMNAGQVDADSVIIGQKISIGSNTTGITRGLVDIGGGRLVAKDLSLAQQAGALGSVVAELTVHGSGEVEVTNGGVLMGSGGVNKATISIEGNGKLTVAGDIAKGAGTTNSNLALKGGTLELNGHNILVDNFAVEAGTLRNTGEINSGNSWAKTGTGTLRLEGANHYTGRLLVSTGTLVVAGSVSQSDLTVADGAAFFMEESGELHFNITSSTSDLFILEGGASVSFNGGFVIDLNMPLGAGTWNLLTGTTQGNYSDLNDIALTGSLSGSLLDQGSGLWQLESDGWLAEFDASTGGFSLHAIPEPSVIGLASLVLVGLAWRMRRSS